MDTTISRYDIKGHTGRCVDIMAGEKKDPLKTLHLLNPLYIPLYIPTAPAHP